LLLRTQVALAVFLYDEAPASDVVALPDQSFKSLTVWGESVDQQPDVSLKVIARVGERALKPPVRVFAVRFPRLNGAPRSKDEVGSIDRSSVTRAALNVACWMTTLAVVSVTATT
jgi:hypothetical protein